MFEEFFTKVTSLSPNEIWADTHGGVAMLTLILFGAAIMLYFMLGKFKAAIKWLKATLVALWGGVLLLDVLGLFVYVPYRAATGPRTTLLASENTAWLHEIMFEHKEFLAFAPLILAAVAVVIAISQGDKLAARPYLKKALLLSVVAALLFVLIVAAEAVLITKAAPLR
jgi:hypothetical protein